MRCVLWIRNCWVNAAFAAVAVLLTKAGCKGCLDEHKTGDCYSNKEVSHGSNKRFGVDF